MKRLDKRIDIKGNKMLIIHTSAFRIKTHWATLPYEHWETVIEELEPKSGKPIYLMAFGGSDKSIRLAIKSAIENLRTQKRYLIENMR